MLHVEAQYLISRGRKRIERREGKRVRVCPSGCIFTDGPTVLHINAVFCYLYFVSHQCFPSALSQDIPVISVDHTQIFPGWLFPIDDDLDSIHVF
ncbi:MAG: hypothetical protein CL912_18205 [Deltaproteobacteria bacterium]|nr:hypothetical protein [Deltaproteobacteria bacterium]